MRKSSNSKKFKIGLGIVTYNRPDYFEQVMDGVTKHLMNEVDSIWVYNDGSTKDYSKIYDSLPKSIQIKHATKNKGVGAAKNWLMQQLIDEGCYAIFIGEDDIIPTSKMAIRGYVQASRKRGIAHMMFAHHGPVNVSGPNYSDEILETYPGCVGGWCFFLAPVLKEIGLHDEHFSNAYEHVELTWRHVKFGATTPFGAFADATGSKKWLKEIPESIDNSSIRKTSDWVFKSLKSLEYWKEKDPEFPLQNTLDNLVAEMKKNGDYK